MSGLSRKKKIIALVAGAAVLLIGGGIGYAFWSSTGAEGSGTAETAVQSNSLTIVQSNTPTGLAPGVQSQQVTAHIDNAAGGHTTFVAQVVVTVSSVAPAPCAVGNYRLRAGAAQLVFTSNATAISPDTPTITLQINQSLDPGDSVDIPVFTIGFVNYAQVNQDVCQGAVPTIHYLAS
jgi:hypothetical protein